jgi:hypothetical protein
VPLALDRVWLAAVTDPMVTRLPAVPESEKPLVKVVVVAAVKDTVTGWVVLRMSARVLEPVIVSAPAPSWLSVALKVDPPPTKVLAVADDILM